MHRVTAISRRYAVDSMTVSLDELGSAISAFLSDYADELESQTIEDVDAAAKVTESELRSRGSAYTGRYAKGWTTEEDSEGGVGYAVRVYNKTKPGLAHLLSKGHVLRNGGFYQGDDHVAKAAQSGISELERRVSNG